MNDFNEKGYLGEEITGFRQKLMSDFSEYFSLAQDLNSFVQKEKFKLSFENNKQHGTIGTIFCRVLDSFQAAILLISYGLAIEAEVVIRSLMEATFLLNACCKDKDYVEKYLKSHEYHRSRFAKNILSQNLSPPFCGILPEDELEKAKDAYEKSKEYEIKVLESAEKANMKSYYYTIYWGLCQSSHVSPKTTEVYRKEEHNDSFFEMRPINDPNIIRNLIYLASGLLLKNTLSTFEFLKYTPSSRFTEIYKRWEALSLPQPPTK